MTTIFKNKVAPAIGTTPVSVLTTASTVRATVIGLSLTNLTNEALRVSISLVDNGVDPAVEAYYIKDVILPANQSLRAVNGGEKLMVAPDNQLLINSNVDSSIDAIVSYVEIS